MRKVNCIEHYWIQGDRNIPTRFKYGSLSRVMWVCKYCGKKRFI